MEFKRTSELITSIEDEYFIQILPFTQQHIQTLSELTVMTVSEDHNDPFDHSIISHAIAEGLTLVSSDRL